jgi:hypothetical protein
VPGVATPGRSVRARRVGHHLPDRGQAVDLPRSEICATFLLGKAALADLDGCQHDWQPFAFYHSPIFVVASAAATRVAACAGSSPPSPGARVATPGRFVGWRCTSGHHLPDRRQAAMLTGGASPAVDTAATSARERDTGEPGLRRWRWGSTCRIAARRPSPTSSRAPVATPGKSCTSPRSSPAGSRPDCGPDEAVGGDPRPHRPCPRREAGANWRQRPQFDRHQNTDKTGPRGHRQAPKQ